MVVYINESPNSSEYRAKEATLRDLFEWYHFGAVHVVTERDTFVLLDLIRVYDPYQFIVYSIKEFDCCSPTMICEFIFKIIDMDIVFTSYEDALYFCKESKLEVYPKVFEIFRRDIPKSSDIIF